MPLSLLSNCFAKDTPFRIPATVYTKEEVDQIVEHLRALMGIGPGSPTPHPCGDRVQLNTGGPVMSVARGPQPSDLHTPGGAWYVCRWFEGTELKEGRFCHEQLVEALDDEEKAPPVDPRREIVLHHLEAARDGRMKPEELVDHILSQILGV